MKKSSVRLPAEWEQQSALLLTWPYQNGQWLEMLPGVDHVFTQICVNTARFQPVIISCFDEKHKVHIQQLLNDQPKPVYPIHFYIVPSNDSWTRDHGPITVFENNHMVLRKFIFNGWGGKYEHTYNNQLVDKLAALQAFEGYTLTHANWILEGGSIETDGEHTLLTTESCLLNKNRNAQLSREDIEQRLLNDLGIDRVLWLKHSLLTGDDTDGHIDMLARFCDSQTICYTTAHPDNLADKTSLLAMEQELQALRTRDGQPYHLIPLPAIAPKFNAQGTQLPASYANFLIINEAVLVPIYGDINDSAAIACLQDCFPNRKIIGIPALALIHQYGSIHCATMNIYCSHSNANIK